MLAFHIAWIMSSKSLLFLLCVKSVSNYPNYSKYIVWLFVLWIRFSIFIWYEVHGTFRFKWGCAIIEQMFHLDTSFGILWEWIYSYSTIIKEYHMHIFLSYSVMLLQKCIQSCKIISISSSLLTSSPAFSFCYQFPPYCSQKK